MFIGVPPDAHCPCWAVTISHDDPVAGITMAIVGCGCAACVTLRRWRERDYTLGL
jgi:hypothetical protein